MKRIKQRNGQASVLFCKNGQIHGMSRLAVEKYHIPAQLIVKDEKVPAQTLPNKSVCVNA